jgi:hypothetical protein
MKKGRAGVGAPFLGAEDGGYSMEGAPRLETT